MNWQFVERNWSDYIDHLLARWPALQRDRVAETAGSFTEFVSHLAASHHLTDREAAETVEDWLLVQRDLRAFSRAA